MTKNGEGVMGVEGDVKIVVAGVMELGNHEVIDCWDISSVRVRDSYGTFLGVRSEDPAKTRKSNGSGRVVVEASS